MVEEASIEFRLRKIDKARNYTLDKTKHDDLMSKKYKKTWKYLSYAENLLILSSVITGCVSISAFAPLIYFSVGITSSVVGIKICAITVGIKK